MEAQPPSQPHILQNSVVVFSKNYLPLARINIKRAMPAAGYANALLVTGQAESVNFGTTKQWEVRSPSIVLQVPEHIRLTAGNPERHWKIPSPVKASKSVRVAKWEGVGLQNQPSWVQSPPRTPIVVGTAVRPYC
jgi:hypothetical protein